MSVQIRNGPRVTAEMALISNPLDTSPTWTDVSEGWQVGRIKRGRSHELDRMRAGTCELRFRNLDDRWNPWNTWSPYYGNLLTANQSSLETNTTGWAAANANTTIARTTSEFLHGAASLQMQRITTDGDAVAITPTGTSGVRVDPGMQMSAVASFKTGGASRTADVTIFWYDLNGAQLSGSTGTGVTATSGGWTQATVTDTAPANTSYAAVQVRVGAVATEVFYVDQISLHGGTSIVWGVGGRSGNLKPMCKLRVRADWNLLTANQASLETDTTGWLANGANTSIARNTSHFLHGAASLSMQRTGSGGDATAITDTLLAAEGRMYTAMAFFEADSTGRSCDVTIFWFNAAAVQFDSDTGTAVTDSTGGWVKATVTAQAPTGAVYAKVQARAQSCVATEVHYVDKIGLFGAPNVTEWSAGGPYYLFTGFVESIEHGWKNKNHAETVVTAVDGFKILSLAKAAKTAYYDGILSFSPRGFWRFNDTGVGSVVNGVITAVDESGNSRNGFYAGNPAGFQRPGALPAELGGSVDLGVRQGWVETPIAACPASGTGNFSVILWVYLRNLTASSPVDKLWHVIDVGSQHIEINIQTNGKARFWVTDGTNGGYLDSNTEIPLLRWVMVTAVKSGTTGPGNWKLYFDKTDVSGSTSTDGTGNVSVTTNSMLIGGRTGSPNVAALDGLVDEHAIIGSALTSGNVTTIYDNSYGLATTALTGARIGKLLDVAGHPTADRSLDAGQFTMQAVKDQLYENSPLPLILDYVDSEGYPAAFFFAGNGYATFHDRAHSTPSSSGTFGDAGGETDPRSGSGGHPPVLDDLDLWTTVVCQAEDGAAKRATDSTAAGRYVDRTLSRTNLRNADDDDVQTVATALLTRYSAPAQRIHSLPIHPPGNPDDLYPHALGREINDRILYKRHTLPGAGTALELDLRLEGVEHAFDTKDWVTTWQAVPT